METWDTLCPGCFAEKGEVAVCPYCGYDESERRTPLVLPYRGLLNGQFLVGKVLGKPGGFGITYLGWDVNLATPVAIKEYLPRDYASRDSDHATVVAHSREDAGLFKFGLEQFLQEARIVARFDHPNVVRVRSFFEQNGTAYLVMDYLQGVNLSEHVTSRGGRLVEREALDLMLPILDGLQDVHSKGFLHRDIKPQNIYITTAGRPILLDFGAARQAMGERSRSLSVILTPGFSPYEQYHRRGEQGPWTDLYAVAATLYYVLTGQPPADAPERVAKDELPPVSALVTGISPQVDQAIMMALSLEASARPQDVFLFRDLLSGQAAVPVAKPSSPLPTPPPVPVAGPPMQQQQVYQQPHQPAPAATPMMQPNQPYPNQIPAQQVLPPQAPQSPQQPMPVQMQHPAPPPVGPYGAPPPQKAPSGGQSSASRWLVVAAVFLVVAAAGWYFLAGGAGDKEASKPKPPTQTQPQQQTDPKTTADKPAADPATTAPAGQSGGSTAITPGPTPGTTTAPETPKPPATTQPDTTPKQPAVTRPDPPADKPAQTPPRRSGGSLW